MAKSGRNYGNVNMRGKRYKIMSCRCCVAADLRHKFNEIEAKKEVTQETKIRVKHNQMCVKDGCPGKYIENSIYCDWDGYLVCDCCGDHQDTR